MAARPKFTHPSVLNKQAEDLAKIQNRSNRPSEVSTMEDCALDDTVISNAFVYN